MIGSKVDPRLAIYLDFEGEGKKKDQGSPPPKIAGVYRPYQTKRGGIYETVFFEDTWRPVKNGSKFSGRFDSLESFIHDLIQEAKSNNKKIIYWSVYEDEVVKECAFDLHKEFQKYSVNLLPIARRLKNRFKKELNTEDAKVLNQYLYAFNLANHVVPSFHPGAAESCRRLEKASQQNKRWRHWSDKQKQLARAFIEYNSKDCIGLYRLAQKVLWHQF